MKEFEILVHVFLYGLLSLLVHVRTRKNVHLLTLFSEIVLYIVYLKWGFVTNKTSQFITLQGSII